MDISRRGVLAYEDCLKNVDLFAITVTLIFIENFIMWLFYHKVALLTGSDFIMLYPYTYNKIFVPLKLQTGLR